MGISRGVHNHEDASAFWEGSRVHNGPDCFSLHCFGKRRLVEPGPAHEPPFPPTRLSVHMFSHLGEKWSLRTHLCGQQRTEYDEYLGVKAAHTTEYAAYTTEHGLGVASDRKRDSG